MDNSVVFDPTSLEGASGDEFMFDTHGVITDYLGKHFRTSLKKSIQTAIHKANPLPYTPAMQVPKVNHFMLDHLKQKFPRSRGTELGTIQSTLLYAAGSLTCLWSDLLHNNLLAGEGGMINAHNVLNVIQRLLILLGNANKLLSQTRRCDILQCVDKSLESMVKNWLLPLMILCLVTIFVLV